ncbi:MAG: type IV toxin-antitoxin system AbiEi family antitoxin domain-containing protein, partial [Euryarchaeota archaeon]|nr:type IV toxin-antitoxin system AbiEi family antitoxin domain-containing protein [Euryarchaeota archaeon]
KYQLLNELAKKGQTFTFEDAARASSLSHQSLKVVLSRMEKEGLIERIFLIHILVHYSYHYC